jgi:hypothetical protein
MILSLASHNPDGSRRILADRGSTASPTTAEWRSIPILPLMLAWYSRKSVLSGLPIRGNLKNVSTKGPCTSGMQSHVAPTKHNVVKKQ